MDVNIVEISGIYWPKTTKEDRTHDTDFIKRLAIGIESDGLLQPIGVRPGCVKEGFKFTGVFGRHRAAAFLSLRRESIPAVVFVDMNDEEAKLAQDAENLWRNPLTKAQAALAMARWFDAYDKKREAHKAALAANKSAEKEAAKPPVKPKATRTKKGGQVQSGPEAPPEPRPAPVLVEVPPEPPTNFAEHAAEVTGLSPTVVKRQLKIGKAFTPAQVEVIEQQGVSQTWQETIANFPQGQRDAIINLIASGKNEEEAIAIVQGTPEVKRADGVVFEVASVPPGQKSDNDMTDDEWVKFHCADILKLIEDPTAFAVHAILYRETRELRGAFKSKSKAAVATAKKGEAYGGLYSVLTRFMNVAHPSKWLRCGGCTGTGIVQEGNKQSRCKDCQGNGFSVKFEAK